MNLIPALISRLSTRQISIQYTTVCRRSVYPTTKLPKKARIIEERVEGLSGAWILRLKRVWCLVEQKLAGKKQDTRECTPEW